MGVYTAPTNIFTSLLKTWYFCAYTRLEFAQAEGKSNSFTLFVPFLVFTQAHVFGIRRSTRAAHYWPLVFYCAFYKVCEFSKFMQLTSYQFVKANEIVVTFVFTEGEVVLC